MALRDAMEAQGLKSAQAPSGGPIAAAAAAAGAPSKDGIWGSMPNLRSESSGGGPNGLQPSTSGRANLGLRVRLPCFQYANARTAWRTAQTMQPAIISVERCCAMHKHCETCKSHKRFWNYISDAIVLA